MDRQISKLLQLYEPGTALGIYLMNTTKPDIRNPVAHRTTLEKVLSASDMPTHKEVVELLVYSETVRRSDHELHKEVFGMDSICAFPTDQGIKGGITANGIYHILTEQFIKTLAHEIIKFGIGHPVVEIAAGYGKLSYGLSQFGVPSTATDKFPGSEFVARRDAQEALSYKPKTVIASWLDTKTGKEDSTIQRDILNCPSVEVFIEIKNGSKNAWIGVDSSGMGHPNFTRVPFPYYVQRYSMPVDLFWAERARSSDYYPGMIIDFKFKSFDFLSDSPTVFVWERMR